MNVSFLCYFQWDVLDGVCPTLCVCDDMYIWSETCMYLRVGAAFVQVWEYLLIPGLFGHPRGARVNV